MAFLHNYTPDPILLVIGSVSVYWYGLLIALALLVGCWLSARLAQRRNLPKTIAESIYVNLVIWGFVGARLYHVLNEWRFYWQNPGEILMVWHGGLAIHGGIIAGAAALFYYARKHKTSFWPLADLFSLPLILGQGIGRWGNYFNQELFGRPTSLAWSIPIDLAHRPAGYEAFTYFHPTFLYESLWNLAVFGFLFWMFTKKGVKGIVFWCYVALYSLGRLGVEFLRIDDVPTIAGVRLPLAVSAVTLLAGLVMTIKWRGRRPRHPTGQGL